MALNTPFFSKRAPQSWSLRGAAAEGAGTTTSPAASTPTSPAVPPVAVAEAAHAATDRHSATPAADAAAAAADTVHILGASQLTVPAQMQLLGAAISQCDTVTVAGTLHATFDARVLRVAEGGVCEGTAVVDCADIHGLFTGSLTVRERLTLGRTGEVQGSVRYGQMVVEAGGQLAGDIAAMATLPTTSPVAAPAAGAALADPSLSTPTAERAEDPASAATASPRAPTLPSTKVAPVTKASAAAQAASNRMVVA